MAWTRTALAFAAVGGVILKASVPAGVAVLATCPLVWAAGRLGGPRPGTSTGTGTGRGIGTGTGTGTDSGPTPVVRRFRLITVTIVVVAVVALVVSLWARGRAA